MRRSYGLAAILLAVLAIAPAGRRFLPASAAVPGGLRGSPLRAFSRLPLSFEPNRGQAPGPVRFLARGPGYPPGATLYLTATGAVLGSFRIRYVSANPHPRIVAMDRLPSRVNYFLGDDPRRWRRDIPTYGRVLYRGLYAGVDLAYDGRRGHLEYDWLLRPGVDPGRIRLVVEDAGPDAARSRSLRVDTRGDLVLRDGTTSLLQERPIVYQQVGSRRRVIPARYSITGPHQIGVTVGRYDVHRSLAIDPTLVYSTYLGGSDGEGATDIAVDPSGNAYITGDTFSLDFPTRDPQRGALVSDATCRTITGQPSGTCTDAFVSKLSPDGQRLLYSTFLGGSRDDYGHGIALDKAGDAYVVGTTLSTDFPAVHAVQSHFGGGSVLGDAFVAELAPAGNRLMYSTYLGGSGDDDGADIAVAGGKVFVTGRTNSANFPVASSHGQPALQPHRGGGTCRYDFQGSRSVPCYDAFVAELDVRSKGLVYSTYLGGSKSDFGWGIAVHAGSAYVVGQTSSGDFPTRGPGGRALQPAIGGGTCATTGSPEPCSDAFIARLAAGGGRLVYSTYLGGGHDDYANDVALDGAGSAYVVGDTQSPNFPTVRALRPRFIGGPDMAFVARIAPSGDRLIYSTFLGGSGSDEAYGVALDPGGNAYVTGRTSSPNFPISHALQGHIPGHESAQNAFVTVLNAAGTGFVYSTFLGGSDHDLSAGIALDGAANVYIAGFTSSTDFPTAHPLQGRLAGGVFDDFIAKIGAVIHER